MVKYFISSRNLYHVVVFRGSDPGFLDNPHPVYFPESDPDQLQPRSAALVCVRAGREAFTFLRRAHKDQGVSIRGLHDNDAPFVIPLDMCKGSRKKFFFVARPLRPYTPPRTFFIFNLKIAENGFLSKKFLHFFGLKEQYLDVILYFGNPLPPIQTP